MTKKSVLGLAIGLAVALGLSGSAQRPSPVPAGRYVAYVSGQRLSSQSNDGKAGASRMQALQQEKAAEVRTKQQALETVRQQLARAGDAAARAALEREEVERRTEFERAVGQAQLDLQHLQRQISSDLMAKVRPILQELVAGTDVQIVLQADVAVLWAAPGLDLTPAVLERLNADVTPEAVPVPLPSRAGR